MTTATNDVIETLNAKRDHHLGELAKLDSAAKVHKTELSVIDKMLNAAKPKRVISEKTRAAMRISHAKRRGLEPNAADVALVAAG